CHFMASWMDRETSSLIQMGGEGVNWAASSRFTGKDHIFQNLGEGTWYHSGSMAIRQAIAAGANITYKILYNDAVAMTGGQPVDGPVSVQAIAHICRAEGVERIALVSDDPQKFASADFPRGITIHARAEMDAVQRELRQVPGVSVLIYEQTCATEKRRRRKRGELPDPKTFAVINELVCEGCGDCSTESNCLSVEPKETEFGRKRQINQSNCNKDFSCLNGFCPSFVTVEGAERRKPKPAALDIEQMMRGVPLPALPALDQPFNLLVTGVGGTGVVTVGQLISMAAHLEGKGASILDFTGFAQKFGAVLSFVRIGRDPDAINQVRIDTGMADAVIGCDVVVSSSPKASGTYRSGTSVALNLASMPTGDLVLRRDADLNIDARASAVAEVVGAGNLGAIDANAASEALFGDAVYANVMMLGFAWQRGLVPVTLDALNRAIELNNVAVDANKRALACGRLMAAEPSALEAYLNPKPDFATSPDDIVARRTEFLEGYQNVAWAERYRSRIEAFAARIPAEHRDALASAAAKSLFKLMSYKDEYEVARLHGDPAFRKSLNDRFEGDFRVVHHFAPPLLGGGKDARGRPLKRAFGPSIRPALSILTRLKGLRGTAFDPFGYTAERRMERGLIAWFETLMARCETEITPATAESWHQVLSAPMDIRGYGPVKDEAVQTVKARVETLLAR
ncbi:MAG: indolepyruvate ferredoxin oxidoreductase family protein, partial [Alphaproteobacteria bacterium]|nr:indolepyruvate ferredoxin oxidoreductase family protein [Alphaproteobacteria bacterium]